MRVVHCKPLGGKGDFECGLEFEPSSQVVTLDDFRNTNGQLPEVRRAA